MKVQNFGVQELSAHELQTVDGGFLGIDDLIVGVAIAVVVEVINDWDHFKEGIAAGLDL